MSSLTITERAQRLANAVGLHLKVEHSTKPLKLKLCDSVVSVNITGSGKTAHITSVIAVWSEGIWSFSVEINMNELLHYDAGTASKVKLALLEAKNLLERMRRTASEAPLEKSLKKFPEMLGFFTHEKPRVAWRIQKDFASARQDWTVEISYFLDESSQLVLKAIPKAVLGFFVSIPKGPTIEVAQEVPESISGFDFERLTSLFEELILRIANEGKNEARQNL